MYGSHDIQTWHRILGHCNFDDAAKLEKVVEGMTIRGKHDRSNQNYEICTQGKFIQSRNREADAKATTVLELVHRPMQVFRLLPVYQMFYFGVMYCFVFGLSLQNAVNMSLSGNFKHI